MKLGLVSALLGQASFEEMVDIVAENGLDSVEVACWPNSEVSRRYAGVSHIDVVNLTAEKASELKTYLRTKGVSISSLAYYPNPLDEDLEARREVIEHLYRVIDASALMEVNMVTTFIGRMPGKTVAVNLEEVAKVWPPILNYAKEKGVRIAFENCPMLFGEHDWPGGQNLFTTPAIWRQVFEILPFDNLGINYDPSHLVWQQIDYIAPLYEFKDKIFHVHFKDIKIYPDKLKDVGTMAMPFEYMTFKLPGLGDVDWGRYVSALTDIGFDGYTAIEVEDRVFENSYDKIKKSISLSSRYLRQFVI